MISIAIDQICYSITNDSVFIHNCTNKIWKYLFQKHIETSLKHIEIRKQIFSKVYKPIYKELYLLLLLRHCYSILWIIKYSSNLLK